MSSPLKKTVVYAMVLSMLLTGCQPGRPFYLRERADLQYYVDQQVDVRYPDTEVGLLDEVTQAYPPLTVGDKEITEFWDLTLEQAVNIALKNTKTFRSTGRPFQSSFTIQGTQATIIDNPDTPSVFEIAIRESEPNSLPIPGQITSAELLSTNSTLDSNQGVEAALAEFDAHYTSSLFWNTTDRPRNFQLTGLEQPNNEASDVTYRSAISKKSATGTISTVRTGVDFNSNNNVLGPNQPLESSYTASLELEINQPLLRGRGVATNRAPIIVARIGGDQTVANTEFFLQNMLTQIEISYWQLYNAYRRFEVAKESVDNALKTYNIELDSVEIGGANRAGAARAAEQVQEFNGQLNLAYGELQLQEANMRFMLGLSASDGRFIRPIDQPVTTEMSFDWYETLSEALMYRPNLRIKRWEIKKKEIGVNYAKNGLLGQLNFVFLYRFLGLGDELFGGDGVDFPGADSGAIDNLFQGDSQEIQLGLTGGYSLGQRREMLNVRNAQLKLARERARLEDMELNVAHELDNAMKGLQLHYNQARIKAQQWLYAHEAVRVYEDQKNQGIDITTVLEAQRAEANARIAFHDSISNYNQFLALTHRLKGTTLQYYNVQFGEGPWPDKAYYDAEELARKRTASLPMNYGYTRPGVVSVGTDPTMEGIPGYGDGFFDGEVIDDGVIYQDGPMIEGGLDPIQETEILPAPDRNNIPAPSGNQASPPATNGPTTQLKSRSAVLQASFLEESRPSLKPSQVRWDALGIERESPVQKVRTRAKLKAVN